MKFPECIRNRNVKSACAVIECRRNEKGVRDIFKRMETARVRKNV